MTFRQYFVLPALLIAAFTAHGAPKEPPPPPPPPMPQGQTISIYRGRSVEIPLRAVGRADSQLKFLIRSRPAHGKLSDIRMTGPKSAVVTYTHDDSAGGGGISFNYAVQGPGTPVSAPAEVRIIVSEEPPALSVVHTLDFGTVTLGGNREEEFAIRNTGGGRMEGKVIAPKPWKILGSPDYQLGRKEEKKFRVLFEPADEGGFGDKLIFTHDPRSSVSLVGEAVSPFEFTPGKEIELSQSGTTELAIRNRTAFERTLEIQVPKDIVAPEQLKIPAESEIRLPLVRREGFLGSLEGKVVVESEGFLHEIPLRVYSLAPVLVVKPEAGLDFGEVQPGRRYKGALHLRNDGGADAHLSAVLPGDFLLMPAPETVVLAPGEKRVFEITFDPRSTGDYNTEIEIGARGAKAVRVPVRAAIAGKSPQAAVKIPTANLVPPESELVPEPGKNDPEVPEPVYNKIPMIKKVTIRKTAERDLELSWPKPADDAVAYVIEQRTVDITPEGTPKTAWHERRSIKFIEENGIAIARLENLAPGQSWFFRISSLDEAGLRSQPSHTIRIVTLPPKGNPWLWVAGFAVIFGGLGYVGWQIRRRREALEATEAERISRLE